MKKIWPWMVVVSLLVVVVAGCLSKPAGKPVVAPSVSEPSTQPAQAEPPTSGEGVAWVADYETGLKQAKEMGKPMLVEVFATWCGACKQMEETVWPKPEVVAASKDFVCVKVDGDKFPEVKKSLMIAGYPTVLFLDANGKEIERSLGAVPYQNLVELMERAKDKGKN